MLIIIIIILVLLFCFGIEYALKARWLKLILNCIVILAASIAAFRIGIDMGSTVERFANASLVEDTFELLENSVRTNTVDEIQFKIMVVGKELPMAIQNQVPTTPKLLKVLKVEPSTNSSSGRL